MYKNHKVMYYVCIYFVFIILFPVMLQYFIFPNGVFSPVSNEGWASFFGSYLGGIAGGVGTLLAVLISTRQTTKIQEENKNITREIQRNNRNDAETAQENERQNIQKVQENYLKAELHKERIKFCSDISALVGKYCADISKYYFTCHSSRHLEADRIVSVECYYILHVRLRSISLESSKNILKTLENIHEISVSDLTDADMINRATNELCNVTTNFIDEYCAVDYSDYS